MFFCCLQYCLVFRKLLNWKFSKYDKSLLLTDNPGYYIEYVYWRKIQIKQKIFFLVYMLEHTKSSGFFVVESPTIMDTVV